MPAFRYLPLTQLIVEQQEQLAADAEYSSAVVQRVVRA
jgi:hypothetical protein